MNTIGNIIWIIFGGFIISMVYFLSGIIMLITIIGIPFGLQLFKIGHFALFPFGRKAVSQENQSGYLSIIMNIIWILIGGFSLAISHLILALLYAVTIIGLPFAAQHIKLAGIALTPFGYRIADK